MPTSATPSLPTADRVIEYNATRPAAMTRINSPTILSPSAGKPPPFACPKKAVNDIVGARIETSVGRRASNQSTATAVKVIHTQTRPRVLNAIGMVSFAQAAELFNYIERIPPK